MPLIIVSGGQSGVDRAALDWALRLGWEVRGWCPAGRRAEDGPIDLRYPLRETPSRGYAQRTRWNVRDSDGTLILNRGPLEGGTAFTLRMAERTRRPFFVVQLEAATPEIGRSVAAVIGRGAVQPSISRGRERAAGPASTTRRHGFSNGCPRL